MKRVLLYAVLFPLIVCAFMFALERVNPLKVRPVELSFALMSAYAIALVPAILTAWANDALRHRGYRSIYSVFVGMTTLPGVVYFIISYHKAFFGDVAKHLFAYAVAGLLASTCCWVIARLVLAPRTAAPK